MNRTDKIMSGLSAVFFGIAAGLTSTAFTAGVIGPALVAGVAAASMLFFARWCARA